MQNANFEATVSYNNGLTISDNVNYTDTLHYPYYWDIFYYPIYYPQYPLKSNVEQAFKIVSKLMERGIIGDIKVKEFTELVNEISNIL